MSLKRKTIIFVSGVALAAWISAAMTPGRPPAPSISIRPSPIDTKGAVLAGEIARLRERLRPDAAPREAARNPFAFRSSQRAAPAPRAGATADRNISAASPGVDIVEPQLRLTLAGIAEDPGPAGGVPVRTAIIAGNGQLFLVKEGDTVTDRDIEYRVGNISADSAELTDLRNNTVRRLTLR
ncbi:MAG TPA: hypothetical protein VGJ39_12140 [Vicinamibacterales bacterium]